LKQAEHAIGEARRDLGASGVALEAAAGALHAANLDLGGLHARHRGALYGAAVEAAATRLQHRAVPLLVEMLNEFGVVEGLRAELQGRGFGADPDQRALNAAHEIGQLIARAKHSIGIRGDGAAARRFLDDLAVDADLELPDPGAPTIEHFVPPGHQPIGDWSEYTNRLPETEGSAASTDPGLPNPATDADAAWRAFHPQPAWSSPFMPARRSV
jgi:hypothetical protein